MAPDDWTLAPASIDGVFDEMVDLRRAVHRQPELAFAEHATTALIRDRMAAFGIAELDRVVETGGIFAMDGGRPGRTVVMRADIDALPVHEDAATTRSTPTSTAPCTPAGTTSTWRRCSAWPSALSQPARSCRAATSSSSSRRRRHCAGPRGWWRRRPRPHAGRPAGRIPRDLAAADRVGGPARGHRHVRGPFAAHHAVGARWPRRHPDRQRRRDQGHGRPGDPPGDGGRRD